MTDYTPEKVTELIAEAREWPRDGVNEGPLINALADALEAAHMHVETIGDFLQAERERAEWHALQEAGLRDDVATLEAERDEALAVIADAREVLTPVYPASLGPVGEELVRILSRIPEHPKED